MIRNTLQRQAVRLAGVLTACLLLTAVSDAQEKRVGEEPDHIAVSGTLRDEKFERLGKVWAVVVTVDDKKKTIIFWRQTDSLGRFCIPVPKVEHRTMDLLLFHPAAGADWIKNLSQADGQSISIVMVPSKAESEANALSRWRQLVPQFPTDDRERLQEELKSHQEKTMPKKK